MIDPLTAATLISGGVGLADKLFSSNPRDEALTALENQANRGLDPRILRRALKTLRARTRNDVSGALGRLRAGGIDPRSGLAQETAQSIRNAAGEEGGGLREYFDLESERARTSANQALAGLPEDESTADLISSLVMNLGTAKYGQGKGAAAQQPISLLDPSKIKMRGLDRLNPRPLPTRLDYLR